MQPSTFSDSATTLSKCIQINESNAFKHASLPINSPIAAAIASPINPNNTYLSIATTSVPSSTPSTTISSGYLPNQNLSGSSYAPLAKHWLWNSNLFYSQSRPIHDGFLPYTSTLGSFFGSKLRETTTLQNHGHQNNSEINKNADISSSSYCSDANSDSDSLDVDGKTTPPLLTEKRRRCCLVDIPTPDSATKKRNPYSIEELLKKPEKKSRRIEPIPFQPSILVHNDESSKASTPPNDGNVISDTNESYLNTDIEESKSINNNNHITIEVCD